jgi:hypothetical protein
MADTDKSRDRTNTDDNSSDVAWTLVGAVLFGIPTLVIGAAATGWDRATAWLLEHEFLLPATADPVVTIPDTGGAGVDLARIVLAVGALAVLSLAIRLVAGLVESGTTRSVGSRERPR